MRLRYQMMLLFSLVFMALSFNAVATVFPDRFFRELDYGLYWFGSNNNYQKSIDGQRGAFYDPTRPTVIYIHGWQPTSVDT